MASWKRIEELCREIIDKGAEAYPDDARDKLNGLLYAFDQSGSWCQDCEIKDENFAIEIWAVVEYLRVHGDYPEDLVL